jgi:hypothetical protein
MNRDVAAANVPRSEAALNWLLSLMACVVFLGPLVVVSLYYAQPVHLQIGTSAETVGIAVIVRAVLRRLFRSGARSALQTTVGTVARASSRTMTRRAIRVGVRSLSVLFRSPPPAEDTAKDDNAGEATQSLPYALGLGFAALSLSLVGVLLVIDLYHPAVADQARPLDAVLGGLPMSVAALLGGMPLLVYACLLAVAAPRCGARVTFRTGWEALLLQAYFTGSGSFLPLSTDSEMTGQPAARARLALVSLGGLLALHLACSAAGYYFDFYPLQYVAGMFLLYCFVFSFPIAPLDGYYLWAYSRWQWLIVWIPILASFIWIMPESLHVIL